MPRVANRVVLLGSKGPASRGEWDTNAGHILAHKANVVGEIDSRVNRWQLSRQHRGKHKAKIGRPSNKSALRQTKDTRAEQDVQSEGEHELHAENWNSYGLLSKMGYLRVLCRHVLGD